MKDQHDKNYEIPTPGLIVDSNTQKKMGLQNGAAIESKYLKEINCMAIGRAINPEFGFNKNHTTLYVSNDTTILQVAWFNFFDINRINTDAEFYYEDADKIYVDRDSRWKLGIIVAPIEWKILDLSKIHPHDFFDYDGPQVYSVFQALNNFGQVIFTEEGSLRDHIDKFSCTADEHRLYRFVEIQDHVDRKIAFDLLHFCYS